jgi:hypothetical protein
LQHLKSATPPLQRPVSPLNSPCSLHFIFPPFLFPSSPLFLRSRSFKKKRQKASFPLLQAIFVKIVTSMHRLIACIGFIARMSAVIPASMSGSAGAFLKIPFLFCSPSAFLIFSAATPNAASKCSPGFLTAIGVQIDLVTATCLAIFALCVSVLQRLQFFPEAFFHPSCRHRMKPQSSVTIRAIRACTALASYASMTQLCFAEQVRPCCRHVSKCECGQFLMLTHFLFDCQYWMVYACS